MATTIKQATQQKETTTTKKGAFKTTKKYDNSYITGKNVYISTVPFSKKAINNILPKQHILIQIKAEGKAIIARPDSLHPKTKVYTVETNAHAAVWNAMLNQPGAIGFIYTDYDQRITNSNTIEDLFKNALTNGIPSALIDKRLDYTLQLDPIAKDGHTTEAAWESFNSLTKDYYDLVKEDRVLKIYERMSPKPVQQWTGMTLENTLEYINHYKQAYELPQSYATTEPQTQMIRTKGNQMRGIPSRFIIKKDHLKNPVFNTKAILQDWFTIKYYQENDLPIMAEDTLYCDICQRPMRTSYYNFTCDHCGAEYHKSFITDEITTGHRQVSESKNIDIYMELIEGYQEVHPEKLLKEILPEVNEVFYQYYM